MRLRAEGPINERVTAIGSVAYPGYVVQGDGACLMIDAGLNWLGPAYLASLRELLGDPGRLDYLLLTHSHYDHVGAASYLKSRLPGLRLGGHERLAGLLQKPSALELMNRLSDSHTKLREACASDERLAVSSTDMDVALKEGDELDLGGLTCKVYETPGHTRDSLSFHLLELDALFVGDACGVLEVDPEPHVRVEFLSSYQDYLDSIERIAALAPRVLGLAHRWVLTGDAVAEFLELSAAETGRHRELIERYLDAANGDSERALERLGHDEYDVERRHPAGARRLYDESCSTGEAHRRHTYIGQAFRPICRNGVMLRGLASLCDTWRVTGSCHRGGARMTIVRRMLAGYAGLLFLLLLVAGVGMGGILWLDSRFNHYSETTRSQVIGAAAIRESSLPMSYIAKASVLATTEARRSKYLKDLDTAWTNSLESISAVAALEVKAGENDEAAALEALKTSLNEYHTALLAVVDLAETDPEQAITEVESRLVPMGQTFDGLVHEYEDAQVEQDTAQIASLSRFGSIMVFVMAAVVALAIVAAVLLQVLTSRDIGRRLRGAVASLSSSSAEILAIASQVAAGAAQTAASTNEATVTVEEVRQTAVLAHEKAAEAAEGAQAAVGMAGSARTLVDETISGIEHMQSEMDVVSETINRLSEQTQAAGEVISSVNDIAEQSNLLSVNASIEAAKAGDHGKGFAVVAQEVKTLAEQSKQAVAQVRTILTEIQKASQQAVQAAAHGRDSVEAGRRQSLEAGEVIQRVADGAARDAQSSVQVTASSQQQLAGMEQIAQAISSINAAGQQSVAGTRQVEQEVVQLQELAVSLRSLIDARVRDKNEAE